MEKLLGVVMCGGESRRMGTDKGLIPQGNKTWAQLTYAKLSRLNIPVRVSINATQTQSYIALFKAEKLITDALNLQGPLNGILSVHSQYPDKDILILACDMTDMDAATLQQLTDAYYLEPGYQYYTYHNGEFFEPLCAIYTAQALSKLTDAYGQGQLNKYRLQNLLNSGNTKRLQVSNAAVFNNVNSK
jgi:molybdopterin-guanine dinucleotide biosynthesis protein A